jgi:hypothetical protein
MNGRTWIAARLSSTTIPLLLLQRVIGRGSIPSQLVRSRALADPRLALLKEFKFSLDGNKASTEGMRVFKALCSLSGPVCC